jgi:hypothetical protein
MEENTQQINQKPSLPKKTKIAAWWMIAIIMIGIITGVIGLWLGMRPVAFYILSIPIGIIGFWLGIDPGGVLEGVFYICIPFVLFLSCLLLFRRKKLGWYWSVITLSLIIIVLTMTISYVLFLDITGKIGGNPASGIIFGFLFYSSIFLLIILLPPLILLLLDRKNFFKVVT